MAMRRRIKDHGERDLRLRFMRGTGLAHDPARLEDAQESARVSLKLFQQLETRLRTQEMASILGPADECWLEIYDMAVDLYAAAHDIGFIEGVAKSDRKSHIAAYYNKFPERRLIAKYVRRHHGATPIEICRYIDKREEAQVSSIKSGKRHTRPYPLPWQSKERDKGYTKRELERRQLWIDPLTRAANLHSVAIRPLTDEEKTDLTNARNLRSFLTKEIRVALCDEDAQMHFVWQQVKAGKVIEPDGFRQVRFGDTWSHQKSFGAEIPPRLEPILREREAADRVRVGTLRRWRSHRYLETLADVLPEIQPREKVTIRFATVQPRSEEDSCANADSAMNIPSPS